MITRTQLRSLGLTEKRIQTLVKRGDIARVHPGTYISASAVPSWEMEVMAAVSSLGDACAVGMRSAGRLLGLDGCASSLIEVVRTAGPKSRSGVTVHPATCSGSAQGTEAHGEHLRDEAVQVLRDGGLPLPERQIAVYEGGTFIARPDFLYVKARVAIEAVSRKHHLGPTNEARDADRRKRLIAAGYTVVEVKWREMIEDPAGVVARLAEALGMCLF